MNAMLKDQPEKKLIIDPIALKCLADFLIILFQIDQGKKTMRKDA